MLFLIWKVKKLHLQKPKLGFFKFFPSFFGAVKIIRQLGAAHTGSSGNPVGCTVGGEHFGEKDTHVQR